MTTEAPATTAAPNRRRPDAGARHRRGRRDHAREGAAVRGARPEARRVRAHPQHPRPPPHQRRARDVLGHVERALLLQVVEDLPAPVRQEGHARDEAAPDGGHGRERRRARHRRGLGGHVQDRVAQPPELHRAVPGRRDRRRRHRARHHLDGRAPGRRHGRAALRRHRPPRHRARRARRRLGHQLLRQLPRPAEHRRRDLVRLRLPGEPARERARGRRAAPRGPAPREREGRRQQGRAVRCAHRRRRHRRRVDPRVRHVRRGRPHQASRRAGRRPVRREGAHRVLPRAVRGRPRRGHPGPGRGRHLVRDLRARVERRRRHVDRARRRAAARPHAHARGDPHEREPGAHDGDRARPRSSTASSRS